MPMVAVAGGGVADRELIDAVRVGLRDEADPSKAAQMRAYMRSELPMHGVQKPARQRLTRRVFAEHPLAGRDDWVATVLALWDEATHREQRYVAMALTGHRPYRAWRTPDLVPLYEYLIVSGGWWDFVDELSIHRVGGLLRAHPAELTPVLRAWAGDPDRWKRRCAVICQVSAGADTNVGLLAAAIEANQQDGDFFLRKGIGWALRQHAKIEPDWVAGFVAEHPALSTLSRREALKHISARERR